MIEGDSAMGDRFYAGRRVQAIELRDGGSCVPAIAA
jgi:hypothetical protein